MNERDQVIVEMYQKGITQVELAAHFGISKARVGQILTENKVEKVKVKYKSRVGHDAYIGLSLSPEMKTAMIKLAEHDGVKLSVLIRQLFENALNEAGIPLSKPADNDPWLPLEAENEGS